MAFLDNSGDIILDAVLTDTGRLRLAQGDGSFKISKFALGDDEINYELYDKAHQSGSAYFDLQIMQTPVLEAFTNNTSNLKTKLISISRTNVLFMPILALNRNTGNPNGVNNLLQNGNSQFFSRTLTGGALGTSIAVQNRFYVAVDDFTAQSISAYRANGSSANVSTGVSVTGLLKGFSNGLNTSTDLIRIDQGLDTDEIPASLGLDSDLLESAYIIELDYRLGRVKRPANDSVAAVNFIDDDNIASYYVTDGQYINPKGSPATQTATDDQTGEVSSTTKSALDAANNFMVYEGPRGSTVQFRIEASQELKSSTYLFNQIGQSEDAQGSSILGFQSGASNDMRVKDKKVYYIDTTVRVVGANTGYRLDVPVRYIKIS
tara:strand:- start:516 stop:1646 length:1131 start_codon:yes stop_codon:yes gene_type:complete